MPEIRLIGIQLTEIGAADWEPYRDSNVLGADFADCEGKPGRCGPLFNGRRYILSNTSPGRMHIDNVAALIYATDASPPVTNCVNDVTEQRTSQMIINEWAKCRFNARIMRLAHRLNDKFCPSRIHCTKSGPARVSHARYVGANIFCIWS